MAERGARTVGATLGIQTADAALRADVEELAHLDAGGHELVAGGHNVGNNQIALG